MPIPVNSSDKANKLKKMNVYEGLVVSFEGLIKQTMDENLNVLDFRNNLKQFINQIIQEITDYEQFFIKMLSYLETPKQFISHGLNTAIYAYILCVQLDIEHNMVHKILTAALLHDIGKLDYNEKIKECYLFRNEDPAQILKYHPIWSQRILLYLLKFGPDICDIVLNHHEFPDGSGFPRSLKEDQLSLSDNILITANLIDIINQKTHYSGIESLNKAVNTILLSHSNKLLPSINNALIEILELKSEGRHYKRFKLCVKGYIKENISEINVPCEIINISAGGLRISTTADLNNNALTIYQVNAKITNHLFIKDKHCKVVWGRNENSKFLYGLKFLTTNDTAITSIEAWLLSNRQP